MSTNESIIEDASEAEKKFRSGEIYSGRKLFIVWCAMLSALTLYIPATVYAVYEQDKVYFIIGFAFLFLCYGGILFASVVMTTLSQTKAYIQAKLLIRKAKHLNVSISARPE